MRRQAKITLSDWDLNGSIGGGGGNGLARESKVNPQRQIGGQSILPNLFYAGIKIELNGDGLKITRCKTAQWRKSEGVCPPNSFPPTILCGKVPFCLTISRYVLFLENSGTNHLSKVGMSSHVVECREYSPTLRRRSLRNGLLNDLKYWSLFTFDRRS